MAGYDPTGDQATETELGEMARPECILAAKATASANAASIDDSATDTVTGTCFAVTNAHFGPFGWGLPTPPVRPAFSASNSFVGVYQEY